MPLPPTFQVHDLIQILVDERSVHQPSVISNRSRNFEYEVEFADAIVLLDGVRLRADQAVQAEQPTIAIETEESINVQGNFNRNDTLTFVITAEIAEILPNGNLVLEASANIAVDNEVQNFKFSGVTSPQFVTASNTVMSSQVSSKRIDVHQMGPTRDLTRRGWVTRIIDMFRLF